MGILIIFSENIAFDKEMYTILYYDNISSKFKKHMHNIFK